MLQDSLQSRQCPQLLIADLLTVQLCWEHLVLVLLNTILKQFFFTATPAAEYKNTLVHSFRACKEPGRTSFIAQVQLWNVKHYQLSYSTILNQIALMLFLKQGVPIHLTPEQAHRARQFWNYVFKFLLKGVLAFHKLSIKFDMTFRKKIMCKTDKNERAETRTGAGFLWVLFPSGLSVLAHWHTNVQWGRPHSLWKKNNIEICTR